MKTADVTLVYSKKGKKLQLHVYIKRTSEEVFNLGTSSFLINFKKYSLSDPKLTFSRVKYSTGSYKPIWIKMVLADRCLGFQVECTGIGKPVLNSGEFGEKLATVEMIRNNENYNLEWRLRDTAVQTSDLQPVETNYFIHNINQTK